MCALRLVAGDKAGPNAVGILVPPSRRTVLIVRPRSLPFDLLVLAAPGGSAFREFEHEQAGRAAEALLDALGEWSGSCPGRVDCTPAPNGLEAHGFHVRASVGPFHLLACERQPGKPYAAHRFEDVGEARDAADRIEALFSPPPGSQQEIYLNTRHFQR
jgi:hypothetical protein